VQNPINQVCSTAQEAHPVLIFKTEQPRLLREESGSLEKKIVRGGNLTFENGTTKDHPSKVFDYKVYNYDYANCRTTDGQWVVESVGEYICQMYFTYA
jgi:hypothetical protein